MRFDLTKLPVMGGVLLGLALGILSVSLVFTFMPSQDYRRAYGHALAGLTARYSADEVFHQNLVAQQSLLSELVKYPAVALASIHDAQQKLRVQAGHQHLAQLPSAYTFSSPILFHDRVAGYVRVTIVEPVNATANIQVGMMWLGILLLLATTWIAWRSGSIRMAPKTQTDSKTRAKPAPNHPPQQDNTSEDALIKQTVYAAIEIRNVTLLKQQLSVGMYQNTLSRLEKITQQVFTLYQGTLSQAKDGNMHLSFENPQGSEQTLFNAICASYLILELANTINNIPLELCAFVCLDKERLNATQNLPVSQVVIEIDDEDSEEFLKTHIEMTLRDNNSSQKVISQFSPPTKRLLQDQYKQLSYLI